MAIVGSVSQASRANGQVPLFSPPGAHQRPNESSLNWKVIPGGQLADFLGNAWGRSSALMADGRQSGRFSRSFNWMDLPEALGTSAIEVESLALSAAMLNQRGNFLTSVIAPIFLTADNNVVITSVEHIMMEFDMVAQMGVPRKTNKIMTSDTVHLQLFKRYMQVELSYFLHPKHGEIARAETVAVLAAQLDLTLFQLVSFNLMAVPQAYAARTQHRKNLSKELIRQKRGLALGNRSPQDLVAEMAKLATRIGSRDVALIFAEESEKALADIALERISSPMYTIGYDEETEEFYRAIPDTEELSVLTLPGGRRVIVGINPSYRRTNQDGENEVDQAFRTRVTLCEMITPPAVAAKDMICDPHRFDVAVWTQTARAMDTRWIEYTASLAANGIWNNVKSGDFVVHSEPGKFGDLMTEIMDKYNTQPKRAAALAYFANHKYDAFDNNAPDPQSQNQRELNQMGTFRHYFPFLGYDERDGVKEFILPYFVGDLTRGGLPSEYVERASRLMAQQRVVLGLDGPEAVKYFLPDHQNKAGVLFPVRDTSATGKLPYGAVAHVALDKMLRAAVVHVPNDATGTYEQVVRKVAQEVTTADGNDEALKGIETSTSRILSLLAATAFHTPSRTLLQRVGQHLAEGKSIAAIGVLPDLMKNTESVKTDKNRIPDAEMSTALQAARAQAIGASATTSFGASGGTAWTSALAMDKGLFPISGTAEKRSMNSSYFESVKAGLDRVDSGSEIYVWMKALYETPFTLRTVQALAERAGAQLVGHDYLRPFQKYEMNAIVACRTQGNSLLLAANEPEIYSSFEGVIGVVNMTAQVRAGVITTDASSIHQLPYGMCHSVLAETNVNFVRSVDEIDSPDPRKASVIVVPRPLDETKRDFPLHMTNMDIKNEHDVHGISPFSKWSGRDFMTAFAGGEYLRAQAAMMADSTLYGEAQMSLLINHSWSIHWDPITRQNVAVPTNGPRGGSSENGINAADVWSGISSRFPLRPTFAIPVATV